MTTRIQLRRGTASEWASINPVLGPGEPGVETDTGVLKIGDGVTDWDTLAPAFSLTYITRLDGSASLDFPQILAQDSEVLTITVVGAVVGDRVVVVPPATLEPDLIPVVYVSAADTVAIRLANISSVAVDPVMADWEVSIFR